MKIGILTFQNTTNYGAMFQAYALQIFIKNYCECEILNYTNSAFKNRYEINPFKSKTLKEFIKKTIYYKENKKNILIFNDFKNNYLRISKENYDENNIADSDSKYDLFISGSDQVWNFKLTNYDENYFLTFTNNKLKRNSYAASLGVSNLCASDEKMLKKLIIQQNNISVRENEGKNLINKVIDENKKNNLDVNVNIDPVFLLSSNQWNELIENVNVNYDNYLFIYEVAYVPELLQFAKKIANEKKMKILYASASNKKLDGAITIKNITPLEFLTYIKKADIIITSSFHGMAFSTIFNKKFYYGIPKSKTNFGSRLNNLASILNLESRNFINYSKKHDFIDYNDVNKKIFLERRKSKAYIERMISYEKI